MKANIKKAALLLALNVCASAAFATNGDNLIGFGAKSTAMGGTGTALHMGAEGVLKNPALGYTDKEFEFMFSGTYFNPVVSATMAGATEQSSAAKTFMIPSIGLVSRINENTFFGLGAYGVSGLGVDYRDTASTDGLGKMYTSLSLMKFVPSLSYKTDNFRVGASVAVMYGTLSIGYDRNITIQTAPLTGSAVGMESPGKSENLGTGYDVGMAYDWNQFTFGLNYQSKVAMSYKHQLTQAAADFGISSAIPSDSLDQPEEISVGVSYKKDQMTLTADYRSIAWASAAGYKEFGWDNQTVYALGGAYQMSDATTLRAGYNFSPKHVLGDKAIKNTATYGTSGNTLNFFNLIGFPATSKTHYTFGLTQKMSDKFKFDASYVLSPVSTETMTYHNGVGANSYEVKHAESSLTLAGSWNF